MPNDFPLFRMGRHRRRWTSLFQSGFVLVLICIKFTLAYKCPPAENIMPCRCRARNDQIQVWCSHSDLERVNGALENLMRLRNMPAIDELIVENNKMPTLPARAFGALQIGRLLLRNNGLESLSRNAFAGLEDSLEEIYIVEDKLLDFPFDAIEKLRNLEAFTLENSRIKLLPRFSGLNKLKHIRIDGSDISDLPVGAFSLMTEIKQIHITNSKLDRLADGIFGRLDSLLLANFTGNQVSHIQRRCFTVLPRLEVLSVGNNQLSNAEVVGRSMEELSGLKSLDLSNNQFKELPEGSFVNLRSLQLLNLAGNQISRVHTRSFTHLPALRKVDLSKNLLRNIPKLLFDTTPLLEELRIRKNLLGSANEISELLISLKSLRYLDLGDNGLRELPTGTFRDHDQLQTLDLSDNRITRVQTKSFMHIPSLQELSLKNNSISQVENQAWDVASLKELDLSQNAIQEINEQTFKGLTALARMDISHNSLKSISQGLFSSNLDLEFLDFKDNQISQINSVAFSDLSKLQKLDLSRNQLTTIISGTFRPLKSLVLLNLSYNRLNMLPLDTFNEQRSLEELNLRSNSLSFLPIGIFNSLVQLKELNLKHNTIADIPYRMFSGMQKLEHLKLSSNQIRQFDDAAFDDIQSLRSIDLSSNRISRLSSRSFRNLPNLEKFEARDNRISSVEVGVLGNSEGLQVLDLAHNALTTVPDLVKTNPLLKVLDLSHNQITKFEANTFAKLNGLMELYLNDNKLTSLFPSSFVNLSSLTIVDLDGNDIEELKSDTFVNVPRLIYLRISRNRMKRIARSAFSDLVSLDGLDLFMNELEDIATGAFVKTGALKYLNLSHNNLDAMSRTGISSLGSLEVLDLSFNRLYNIDADATKHLIWLVELRMNDNGLCKISGGTFDEMSRLKMLVLRNNRIRHLYESVFYKLRNNIAFLDISGNPLECDCEMTWLRNLLVREELQELTDSTCDGPSELKGNAMKSVRTAQMVCRGGRGGSNLLSADIHREEECKPLTESKRKPRPISVVQPEEHPLFGHKAVEDFQTSEQNYGDLRHSNKGIGEKLLESNDYIPGDTPTIYAGRPPHFSSSPKIPFDSGKSSNKGSGLASLFGIPINFGLNFGISPAFSWVDKNNKQETHQRHSSKKQPDLDPLPPTWLHRPPKGHSVYEAPEYLPSKPAQPYIPLNPSATGEQHVEPSGSVDVHKTVAPKKSNFKFPGSTPKPKPSWHPNYNKHPSPETGFIPIEPFFHQNNKNPAKKPARQNSAEVEDISSFSSTTEKHRGQESQVKATGYKEESQQQSEEESGRKYTQVKIQETTTEQSNERGGNKGQLSLSDFWSFFSGKKSPSKPPNRDKEEVAADSEASYEEEDGESLGNKSGESPLNFSAPIDQPIPPTEPDDEEEYNIPFGEPNKKPTESNVRVHVTGKPTITKIIETDIPTLHKPDFDRKGSQGLGPAYNDVEENEEEEEDEERSEDNPKPSPLIPPVLIGDSNKEPRDWYYTNYHKNDPGGNEILERLLERSKLQDLVNPNSSSYHTSSVFYLSLSLLCALALIF